MIAAKADLAANGAGPGVAGALWGAFLSPGFLLVAFYRAYASLHRRGPLGRLAAAIVWRAAVQMSGCYISRRAAIGPGLRLPHPIGIVIGDGVRIGRGVSIYQHVTVGGAEPHRLAAGAPLAFPEIGDGATLYAGAAIIGPIRVGRNAVVGANAVVLHDVPDGAVVVGAPARIVGGVRSP